MSTINSTKPSFDLLFEYFQIGHTFQISYASGIDYLDSLDIIQNDAKPMLYNVDDGNITLPLARPSHPQTSRTNN
jgi:hypothetical protein